MFWIMLYWLCEKLLQQRISVLFSKQINDSLKEWIYTTALAAATNVKFKTSFQTS
jgi:hypothetical protein